MYTSRQIEKSTKRKAQLTEAEQLKGRKVNKTKRGGSFKRDWKEVI